jgi:hypothetical protein
MLCSRLGIFGKVSTSQLKSNNLNTKNIKPTHKLRISAQWGQLFSEKVKFIMEKKQEKMMSIKWRKNHMNFNTHNNVVLDKIVEINEYNKNLQIEELLTKNFCCLINKHDFGNTRVNIHNKLSEIGTIFCPSVLLNNFSNETFEKIGRETFQKQFIFSICPENYITKLDGYITKKLFMACCCGNIPIYYGKLDDFDKHIFNTNRIILFDEKR